jgi:hypothetical protein
MDAQTRDRKWSGWQDAVRHVDAAVGLTPSNRYGAAVRKL